MAEESSALVERVADELQAALGVRLEILADELQVTVSSRLERTVDRFHDTVSGRLERTVDRFHDTVSGRLERLADRFHDTVSGRLEVAADEFEASLWVRRYGGHVERLRRLSRVSEKLVYLFLVNSEPQSFSTLQRSLSLSPSTIDGAVRSLLARGYIVLDETRLYWVSPPRE